MPEVFEFVPIDLYKANAHTFQIIDGKLMRPLIRLKDLETVPQMRLCWQRKMARFYQKMTLEIVRKSARR